MRQRLLSIASSNPSFGLVAAVLLTSLLSACANPASKPAVSSTELRGTAPSQSDVPQDDDVPREGTFHETTMAKETFEAVVKIDAEVGDKAFQGVWLSLSSGKQLLIDYRAKGFWRPFEGHTVKVEGRRYDPGGQAIDADHFRVLRMQLPNLNVQSADQSLMDLELVEVWQQQELAGRFTEETIGPGRKLSGQKILLFISEKGERYLLHHAPGGLPMDQPARIRARRVEPNPFVARLGGPYLWVDDIVSP